MLGTHDLPLFIATAFVLYATPGVDMLFTLTRTWQHGWRGGVAAALGITFGCVFHTLAAALGLAACSPSALAFKYQCSPAILVVMAWDVRDCARRRAAQNSAGGSLRRPFVQGF